MFSMKDQKRAKKTIKTVELEHEKKKLLSQTPKISPHQEEGKMESVKMEVSVDSWQSLEISAKQSDAITESVKMEIDKKVNKVQNSLFTIFGLFASIVTFFSVEVQILKTACSNFTLAWLSLITLWWLGLFVVLIDYIGKDWWQQEGKSNISKTILFLTGWIFLVGIILACLWNEQQCKENEIHQKFENEYWKKLIELEDKIEHNKMFSEMYF